MTIVISATELKNRVSEILNEVYYHQKVFIVKRYGRTLVKIIPFTEKE